MAADIGQQKPDRVSAPSARLVRLDALRGLAAAGVAVHHLFYHIAPWHNPPVVIGWLTNWIWHWGWTLVDLFFLLSGYVFAHVYLGSGGRPLRGISGQKSFWVARIARLYPLHLVTLIGFAIFAGRDPANTLYAFAAHLVMMQGFVAPMAHTFDNASWSLTMEVVCYVLFASGAALGDKVLARGSVLLVLVPAWLLMLLGTPGGPWVEDALPRGLIGFFLGQILWRQRARLARVPIGLLAAAIVTGFVIQTGHYSPLLPLGLMVWPATLLLALRWQGLESRAMIWLGERSYGIYLINMGVIRGVDACLPVERLSGWSQAGVLALSGGAILLLSEASSRWLETPARRVIRQFYARHEPASSGSLQNHASFQPTV